MIRTGSSSAFTMVEMLATVAALVILLGMMVSLARDVRRRSATELTNEVLARLDGLMSQYVLKNGGKPPKVALLGSMGAILDEGSIRASAWQNNEDFAKALKTVTISGLPTSEDGQSRVLDAWGEPVVFMPSMHPAIGMAPGDSYFFFSAGPDRRYLTREDNLYSYDRKLQQMKP